MGSNWQRAEYVLDLGMTPVIGAQNLGADVSSYLSKKLAVLFQRRRWGIFNKKHESIKHLKGSLFR